MIFRNKWRVGEWPNFLKSLEKLHRKQTNDWLAKEPFEDVSNLLTEVDGLPVYGTFESMIWSELPEIGGDMDGLFPVRVIFRGIHSL